MKYFFIKKSKAQGILEVAIAIYIAIVGILSIINLVIANLRVERFNHNMLISTNLAREGVETVRNLRDTNWMSGLSFDAGMLPLNPLANLERTFILVNNYDLNNGVIKYIGLPWNDCIMDSSYFSGLQNPCKLYLTWFDDSTDKKMYVNGVPRFPNALQTFEKTNFYRIIYINEICYDSNNQKEKIIKQAGVTCPDGLEKIGLQIISQVAWMESGGAKITKAEERIYDWR